LFRICFYLVIRICPAFGRDLARGGDSGASNLEFRIS